MRRIEVGPQAQGQVRVDQRHVLGALLTEQAAEAKQRLCEASVGIRDLRLGLLALGETRQHAVEEGGLRAS